MSWRARIENASFERVQIFVLALGIRTLVAWIFFGSVDVSNDLRFSEAMFAGQKITLPYLPGVQYFIWLAGVLTAHSSLSLTFAYKLLPISCDAMLAVVVYDVCRRRDGRGWVGGLLYALCPIGVIVSAVHAQWDPIFLVFMIMAFEMKDLPSLGWRFFAGVLFFAAIVVKPVPLVLLPFLFSMPRDTLGSAPYARGEIAKLAGFFAAAGWYYIKAAEAGYPLIPALPLIESYAKEGWPLFGLPWDALHKNRLLIVFAMVPIFVAYARRWTDAYGATLAFFALAIGTCGLAPQYLLWLVPFAIVLRRYLFLAVYNGLVVALMLIFYSNPKTSNVPFENSATFATVKQARWLTPPMDATSTLLEKMRLLGDWLIPLTALALVLFLAVRGVITLRTPRGPAERASASIRRAPWAYAGFVVLLFVGARTIADSPSVSPWEFRRVRDEKAQRYDVVDMGRFYVRATEPNAPRSKVDALSLGVFWAGAWSLAAMVLAMTALRRRVAR